MTLEEMRAPALDVTITPLDLYRNLDAVQIMKMLDSNDKTRDMLLDVFMEKLDEIPYNIRPTTRGWQAIYLEDDGFETIIGIYKTVEEAEAGFENYVELYQL